MLEQRPRERRVASAPVKGNVAGLRRIADQRAAASLYLRETAPDGCRACAHSPREVACQGVVAAGIEKQDIGARLALHGPLHEVKAQELEVETGGVLQLSVNRDQVVLAINLQPVPGIK